MKIKTRLLVAIAALLCVEWAHATVYEASSVTMKTSSSDYAMSLLGETSDGYQIWGYQSTTTGIKQAEWQIDGGTAISFPISYFGTNSKRALLTSSAKAYESYERNLTTDAQNSHFLKVKSQTTADFFTWDMTSSPAFASEFVVTGSLSASVSGGQYTNNNKSYTKTLSWTYTGITGALIGHLGIEASYDQGKTWTLAATVTDDATSADVEIDMSKSYVRYRLTAYTKDAYKVVADKDCYITETTDYYISAYGRVIYNASSVVMNTGTGTGTDIAMTKLGVCYGGYQIWACQGINSCAYTRWRIDDNSKISFTTADFMSNTEYTLNSDHKEAYLRKVPEGTQHYHFIKVKGKESATYFSWYGASEFEAYGSFLSAKFSVKPETGISLNEDAKRLSQSVRWYFEGVTGMMIDSVSLDMSYDSGNTWNHVDTDSKSFGNAANYVFSSSSIIANFDEKATQVRYRATVYPKPAYKCVVENGYWQTETEDYPITVADAACEIQAVKLDRSAYSADANTGKRTYVAEVSWTAYKNMTDKFGGAEIQYSVDGGNTWTTTETVTTNSGTQSVKVPTGYTNYMFRLCPYAKEPLTNIAAYRTTAVSAALTTSYAPVVSSLTVANKAEDLTYGQFRKVTLSYTLNDELAQTCSRAYMYYSYDDGNTWIKMKGFVPVDNGQHTVMVDASKSQCKFRLLVNAAIDGTNTPCTLDTDNITLN